MLRNELASGLIVVAISGFLTISQYSCNNPRYENRELNQVAEVEYDDSLPLDSFGLAIIKHYQLPGLAIATIRNSNINEIAIIGNNKSHKGIPLDKNSKFQIASCTKSFTALLVASFVADDIVNWDTKIYDVFTEMEIHDDYQDITVKHILSHTAGLPQFWTDDEVFNVQSFIPNLKGNSYEKRKIFTQWNLNQAAPTTVGEYNYSNGGYVIVAAMLEKLSGKPYEILMKERIFEPFGISSAEFGYPFIYDSTQPHRHMNRDENGIGITMDAQTRMPDPIFNPCGYISLSIDDFAQYILFHTQALRGKDTEIVSGSIVLELFKKVISVNDHTASGMGWQIIYVNGTKTFGHTGSDGTIRSAMSIDPKTGNAVVFVTNIGDQRSELAMVNVIVELLDL